MVARCATIGWAGALSLVVLRVALGWHFFSEGVKKLDGTFSAAGFLSTANGPLGEYYRSFVPTPHNWQEALKVRPVKSANLAANDADADVDVGKPFTADKAYAAWGNQIVEDWRASLVQANQLPGVSEAQQEQAEKLIGDQIKILSVYLESIEPDIKDYHHELDRLKVMEDSSARRELPYLDERVAAKSAELRAMPLPWVAAIAAQERALGEQMSEILANDTLSQTRAADRLNDIYAPQGMLPTINFVVTCVTIAAGLMLMVGLSTRLAALAAALFLLSVMSTQPPWDPAVAESAKIYFGYQTVEVTALLVTMILGTGRWLGLDGVFYRLLFGRPAE